MDLVHAYFPGFFMMFLRISAVIFGVKILGTTMDSKWARLALALCISGILFAKNPSLLTYPTPIHMGLVAAREVVLGLFIGFCLQLILITLRLTGTLIGHEMGFSMAQVMDPTTGLNSPVMGRFFETLCFLFFLNVNGHHKIFEIMSQSFDDIPVGEPWNLAAMKDGLIYLVTQSIALSIRIASPVYAMLLLITTTLIVMSRAVPQVHLMDFSYALRILFAFLGMLWFIGIAGPYIYQIFDTFFTGAEEIVFQLGEL
ncbi:MAG: hypothetical protein CSA62_09445 [Planctomycetota bacterium]|nr:MAG: hypothetical protein CSA62_09445 [Planctomycetota bacterium]